MSTDASAERFEIQPRPPGALTPAGRLIVLITAFLGWFFAGFHMSITSMATRPAIESLLEGVGRLPLSRYESLSDEFNKKRRKGQSPADVLSPGDAKTLTSARGLVQRWFGFGQCAFLFGAAAGGLVFGNLGDRIGRSKGMAAAILTYSLGAAVTGFVKTPEMFLVAWFIACTGVGGMWPNGVALVSEAWAGLSRPMIAGLIGTAANIGIFLLSTIATKVLVTPDDWRWIYFVASGPAVLGLFALVAVPESPRWLAARDAQRSEPATRPSTWEIFRPPYLSITLVAIALATIPLIGGGGSANWMVPWAEEEARFADPPNFKLKAQVSQARSLTGGISSLLGGWIASVVGRRLTYFLNSLILLVVAQYTFWYVAPLDKSFLVWVSVIGFFSGIYFGWLPLFLPELFPTRVRSTGAGVGFNFGHILTATTVFATAMLTTYFKGDYALIGRITSLGFALGMVAILFAPDTSRKQIED